jgi:hypothetical protein
MHTVSTARLAGAVVALALAFSQPAACSAEPTAPAAPPPAVPTISFVIRATNASGASIPKPFGYTLTSIQANGRAGPIRDPRTGEIRPGSFVGVERAPVRIEVEMFPGVVGASILVGGNARKGETLACHVERNRLPVRDALAASSVTQTIISGRVRVSCAYVGG